MLTKWLPRFARNWRPFSNFSCPARNSPLLLFRRSEKSEILLGCAPGHFPAAIIREILGLPFFDGLENKAGDEFRLVTIGVTGRRPATGRIPHPVFAEVCGSDERI